MGNPHDILFRRVFQRVANARDLLRSALPPKVARTIAWQGLRRVDGTFVDKRLRRSHTDLLFTARAGSKRVLLYVLVEHKANDERFTALQLLGYVHAIWARCRRDQPRARLLPPILPFVLHHGERAFASPTSLRGLIDLRGLPAELVALQPDLTFVLDDLADLTEEQLEGRVTAAFARLALLSMQHLRTADATAAEAILRSWSSLTEQLASAENGQGDLLALFSYILQIGCLPEERMATVLTDITPSSTPTMLTTAQQMTRRIVRERGPKWLAKGQARILLRQLDTKFGPLEKPIVARIRRARSEQLDRWADRVLDAQTLASVFSD